MTQDRPDGSSTPSGGASQRVSTSAATTLRLVPLGGLGEFGANCLVLEQPAADDRLELLLVDCGATFPADDYGVDYLHPRFDHLIHRLEKGHRLAGVVLTHGHEDHIGAAAALAKTVFAAGLAELHMWGPPHACALVRYRLSEEGVAHRTDSESAGGEARAVILHEAQPGACFSVGAFDVEMIRMAHSIPQATALCITAAAGRVIHSGDFKIDPHLTSGALSGGAAGARSGAGDGELTDEARLTALGDQGVDLLMSDSTNVLRDGHTGSERQAAFALDRIIAHAETRVVVGLFASNMHRVRAVADACLRHGKKLVLLGRSVRKHVEVGRQLGIIDWPSDLIVSPESASSLARRTLVYIASGTQAEPRAALRRIASGIHPSLSLEPGDVVALSSRIIPGCERAVHRMVDDFIARGVEVRPSRTDQDIHVSGHAYRDEQQRLIEWLRPRAFLPLHGARLHLETHAALARDMGVDRVITVVDGEAAILEAEGDELDLRRDGAVPAGRVSTYGGLVLDGETLRERRQIGRGGVVVVSVARGAGKPRVSICARGVPCYEQVVTEAERSARRVLERGPIQADVLAERVRRAVRQTLGELLGQRPAVDVMIVDLEQARSDGQQEG